MKFKIHDFGCTSLHELILQHYQLSYDELEQIKSTKLSDPYSVVHMKECMAIIHDIQAKHEKILICGDYDCDGICATAILCMAFEAYQIEYGFYIPDRLKEGYGVNVMTLQMAYERGYKNIITVDNGVRAKEAMQFVKEKKMRLILTDHHTYQEDEIECDCFLHPFLAEDAFENCCGAGIALQLARCMIPENKTIVALAALATLADCMNVTKENRNILRLGLQYLNEGCSLPLDALKNKPQDTYTMKMLSYTIIPKINSIGRLSDHVNANNAVRFLLLTDKKAIQHAATQINQINELRKEKTAEMERVAKENLQQDSFEIITHPLFHEGIVGLVASRMASTYHKPFLVLSELEHEYKGSMRSIEGFDLIDYFHDFHGFEKFGGHAQAAGVTIKRNRLNELKEYVQTHEMNINEHESYLSCEKISENMLTFDGVCEYETLAPFGNGFEDMYVYIENIHIQQKIPLANGKYYKVVSSYGIEYLFFQASLFDSIKEGMCVIGKMTMSQFKGVAHVSIVVEEIRKGEKDV